MEENEDIERLAYEWTTKESGQVDVQSNHYCETRDIFQTRLNKMLDDLMRLKKIEEENIYIASAIAGEIGNNSFDHNLGNWQDVMGIFFGYAFIGNKLKIALADRGQGVLETLKKVAPTIKNDKEALKVAFTEKISGRAPENRGNGLKFVRENIKDRKMHLTFISGNAQAEINEQMQIKETNKKIRGCLAILLI